MTRNRLFVTALTVVLALVPSAGTARARDTVRPKAAVTTAEGSVLLAPSELSGMHIAGTASDNRRVRDVWVEFSTHTDLVVAGFSMGGLTSTSLRCRNRRKTCTWVSDFLPSEPGEYSVRAVVTDAAGNRRRSKPVTVYIVGVPSYPPLAAR